MDEQARTFQLNIIMSAHEIQNELVGMLGKFYATSHNDGCKFVADALHTRGDIRLQDGKLLIRLDPQSSPAGTKAINKLLEQLNQVGAAFPGSHRIIQFEATKHHDHVMHAQ